MLILFTSTIFLSALLLFMVQPMAARAVLPLLGGSPSVWNTSMVFFQALLLGGYIYAHTLARINKGTRQLTVHLLVIGLAACFLPIALPAGLVPPADAGRTLWLLGVLGLMIAAPFFLLATTGPLVQSWFARTGHKSAGDPYFLYAASNVGSFAGLLGYPIVVEPLLGLREQGIAWAIGFGALVPLLMGCAIVVIRAKPAKPTPHGDAPNAGAMGASEPTRPASQAAAAPNGRTRIWWVFLSFVPSSMVLGTTQFLSTDIAAIPLMWVIPLSIYLLSFVIAFSGRVAIPERVLGKAYAYLAVALTAAFLLRGRDPIILLILLHLVALLIGTTLCHTRLAATRPHPARLTEFYLWIAVGGVLGGIFNALVAPVLFNDVLEYPIAIALVGLAIAPHLAAGEPGQGPARARRIRGALNLGVPLLAGALVLVLGMVAESMPRGSQEREITSALRVGLPCILCFMASTTPLRFTLTIAMTLIVSSLAGEPGGRTVYQERTFFGVLRVLQDGQSRTLRHGTTAHGMQLFTPEHQRTPLVYYHPDGPLGDVMRVVQPGPPSATDAPAPAIGAIGMGVGAVAAYTLPGQPLTFYEIDPAIDRIARDPNLFTFVRDARGSVSTVIGDGRLAIANTPDHRYGLIILDAFSSDAIPVHLLTREAIAIYRTKLITPSQGQAERRGPGGIIAFHVSNVHIDLVPPLAGIAKDLGLAMLVCTDLAAEGTTDRPWPSVWVVMAETPEALAPFTRRSTDGPVRLLWQTHEPGSTPPPVWTDDHANILAMFKW
jgi:hypothetical protein